MSQQEMKKVKVWDAPVRLFHWVVVGLLCFQYVSVKISGNWMVYHMWSGYTLLTLVLFRIVWGFVGSHHARFGDFLYGPRAIVDYLRTLPRRQAAKFAGHNPVGGLSVVLMLLLLLVQAGTGLFAYDDTNMVEGPLAHFLKTETSALVTTIHRYNFYALLAVVAAHIGAVLFYLLYKSENLVKAMFTGEKLLPATHVEGRIAGIGAAAAVMAVAAAAVYLIVTWK
jgi:cytochrome b